MLLALVGALFGVTEAFALAAGAVGVVAASVVRSLVVRPDVEIRRDVSPTRGSVGERCRVALSVTNRSRRTSPAIVVTDTIPDRGPVKLQVAPLRGLATTRDSFGLVTERRGLLRLGPAEATVIDPFGLTARTVTREIADTVVAVWPTSWVLDIVDFPGGPNGDNHSSGESKRPDRGDEFSSLHEYSPGDDVRHIHWPSTARLGRPVVRRNEPPEDRRSIVIVDCRAAGDPAAFERALSVAASLVRSSGNDVVDVVVVGAGGGLAPIHELSSDLPVSTPGRSELLLDKLCVLEVGVPDPAEQATPDATAQLTHTVSGASGRTVVVVSPRQPGALNSESDRLVLTADRSARGLLISTSSMRPSSGSPAWLERFETLQWDGSESFPVLWRQSMAKRSGGRTDYGVTDPVAGGHRQ